MVGLPASLRLLSMLTQTAEQIRVLGLQGLPVVHIGTDPPVHYEVPGDSS